MDEVYKQIVNIAKKPIWANICCFALFYYAFD